MFYRVQQFIWALESHIKKIDIEYVDRFLNEKEKKLFYKLIKSEQTHSIRVSKYMIKNCNNENINEIAKLGLLHDLGKTRQKLNVFEKSFVVILDKITKGSLRSYNKSKKIDIYYKHAEYGVEILKKIDLNYDEDFINAVNDHHKYKKRQDDKSYKLNLLIDADNIN